MDALSICSSAASVVALVGTLTTLVARFIVDVKSADRSVQEFVNCMTALEMALSSVETTFNKKPKQLDFERKHWEDIHRILEACRHCVYQLNKELPELPKKSNLAQRTQQQLLAYVKSNLVASLQTHISSYTQCLQVSMSAMMVVSHWRTQDSQVEIITEIQKLRKDIADVTGIFKHRRLPWGTARRVTEGDTLDELTLEEIFATQNIEKWCGSAQAVAFSVSKLQPGQVSLADQAYDSGAKIRVWNSTIEPKLQPHGSLAKQNSSFSDSISGLDRVQHDVEVDLDSDADSLIALDPELTGCPPLEIMEEQIEENQRVANEKVEGRWFLAAERDQVRIVNMYEQREKVYGIAFSNKAEMDEKLVNIYFGQGTPNALAAAKDILKRLFQRENDAPTNPSRRAGLRHYLAMIYEAQGRPVKAKKWAFGALERRRSSASDGSGSQDTLRLIARLHRQLGEDADASVIERQLSRDESSSAWSVRDLRRSITGEVEPPKNDKNLYTWLEDNGFDSLESTDGNNTPLKCAIDQRNVEILTSLAQESSKVELEITNTEGATPLLLAATSRHKHLVEALLSAGCDPAATDNEGNTALHRAQSSGGGVQVAIALLSAANIAPDFVNQRNSLGETALHRAVRFGNSVMVEELLSAQADINLKDAITGATPLHVAVYERQEEMVRLLLERGADFTVGDKLDSEGPTPLEAAQGAKPALPVATRLLQKAVDASGRRDSVSTRRTAQGRSSSVVSAAEAEDSEAAHRRERNRSFVVPRRLAFGARGSI